MRNSMKAAVLGVFAVGAALIPNSGATAAPATTAGNPSVQMICGFAENAESAWYGHCGNSYIQIKVDVHPGYGTPYTTCVGPWTETYLGTDEAIDNAYYTGRLC
ncbi:DUF6355 family natural product biosynthesis protein [Saccharothrix saharensis]|uniref:DUF6355 family natural product biosynthesis protein n=1 Tax=Saccharothrix saharensis TaxID=571190 RepID=UPI003697E5E7